MRDLTTLDFALKDFDAVKKVTPKEHEKRVKATTAKKSKLNLAQGPVQQKWFDDRMRDMGIGAKMAAEHFGTYPNMVWRMLSGQREVTPGEIAEWARYLKMPLATAFQKFGYVPPEGVTVRVIGAMRSNGRVTIFPPHEQREIESPDEATPLVALVVEAPQSALAIFDGSFLYYEPSTIVKPDAFGRLSVIELGDHAAPVVGVLDRASLGRGRVVVFGGTETIESREIVSATPVKWQRAG